MKKIKLILVTLLGLTSMVSCMVDDERSELEENFSSTPYVVGFRNSTASPSFVTDGEVKLYSENILLIGGQTYTSTPNINVSFEVDPSSTAILGTDFDFVETDQSVTIPANRDFGKLEIEIYSDAIDVEDPKVIVLNIVSADNGVVADDYNTITITINGICFSDIGGLYSVTTTYGYHDFLPDYNPHTMEMEIEALGDGQYRVFDMSGGLYSSGPYADAYGTGPTSIDVIFTENCGEISWSGQVDPWGNVVPLEDGVNSVDPETGIITISWYCEGYGENGVSVYTPI